MAAATAVFAPASATAPLLHHRRRRCRHNYSCGLAIARPSPPPPSSGGVRRRAILPSCGYGRAPLVPASDHWGNWTFLLSAAALGIWSEKRTPTGKALTGALVSVLLGLAASSAGVVAADAPAYRVALDYLLPLAIPLLLFRADLLPRRRVFRSAGALLLAFLLGSAATAMGTVVAFLLVPMRSLGPDNWKIAVALMSRHIGGAFSFADVCEALGVSPSVVPAGLAAGNAISALYFTGLFALAAKIPAEESQSTGEGEGSEPLAADNTLPAAQSAMAVAAAVAICRAGKLAASMLGGITGASLPYTTATLVMALATLFPSQIAKLAPSDALAAIVMQVLFTVVGVNASIGRAITTTPSIFAFAFLQVAVHLLLTLGMGKLLRFDRKVLLVASAANVGGLTTACGMAAAKGWTSLVATGIFGIGITTFMGAVFSVLLSYLVLSRSNPVAMAMIVGIGFGSLVAKTFVGIGSGVLALKFIKGIWIHKLIAR